MLEIDTKHKHTKNGRIIREVMLSNGITITFQFFPGKFGESGCIHLYNGNLLKNEDEPKEFSVTLLKASELKELSKAINAILTERKKTLKKKKKTSK